MYRRFSCMHFGFIQWYVKTPCKKPIFLWHDCLVAFARLQNNIVFWVRRWVGVRSLLRDPKFSFISDIFLKKNQKEKIMSSQKKNISKKTFFFFFHQFVKKHFFCVSWWKEFSFGVGNVLKHLTSWNFKKMWFLIFFCFCRFFFAHALFQ